MKPDISNEPTYWIVVPAAGIGSRMGAGVPKQYLPLLQKTILEHTLDRLLSLPIHSSIYVAISDNDNLWPTMPHAANSKIKQVRGGHERADSVLNCLNAMADCAQDDDWVLVHDAARPCIRAQEVMQLVGNVSSHPVGGILGVPVTDTLKHVFDGAINNTLDRSLIWQAQTPQMFRFGLLRACLMSSLQQAKKITDEASALEMFGHKPLMVRGRADNIKITRAEDLAIAAMLMQQQSSSG